MILVQGWVRLAPGETDAVADVVKAMVVASRAEEGCIDYAIALDLAEPDLVRISEVWRSAADLDAHFLTPHMATFNAALGRLTILGAKVMAYDASGERVLMAR